MDTWPSAFLCHCICVNRRTRAQLASLKRSSEGCGHAAPGNVNRQTKQKELPRAALFYRVYGLLCNVAQGGAVLCLLVKMTVDRAQHCNKRCGHNILVDAHAKTGRRFAQAQLYVADG